MADEETDDQQTDEFDEQSDTSDQAEAVDSGVEGDEEASEEIDTEGDEESDDADPGDEDDSKEVDLIGQAKFDELKDDPTALRKELNRAATKKFQELSGERKRLAPYAEFVKAYEANPRAAASELAQQLGIEIVKPKSEVKAEAAVEAVSDQIKEGVRKALGPEYEDLADRLGEAIHSAASLIVGEAIKPLQEGQNTLITESSARESEIILRSFAKDHPDWKDHESAMVALTKKMPVGSGMSEREYLDNIYILATSSGKEGDATKKAAKRMVASARKSGGNTRTVSDKAVSKSPATGKLPSFGESAAAARRGERFD